MGVAATSRSPRGKRGSWAAPTLRVVIGIPARAGLTNTIADGRRDSYTALMNRIDAVFAEAKKRGRTVFIPFLAAGDPDLPANVRIVESIAALSQSTGVPMIVEVGFPYSDPLADGPIIQAAYTRALDHGVRVSEIFAAVRELRKSVETPMVAMVAYAIVFRREPEHFLEQACEAGFDGVIIPDLPVEEAGALHQWADPRDFKVIHLIAPTTREDRIPAIASASTGFVYYVSVTGITGERSELPVDLVTRVELVRRHAKVPVAVGFGIREAAQVANVARIADGVIVGSALVRRVAEAPAPTRVADVESFLKTLVAPLSTR